MKTMFAGSLALLASVGCAASAPPEPTAKKSSDLNYSDFRRSDDIEDRRDDPPDQTYPNEDSPPLPEPDTSPGSLADQAGYNDIGKSAAPPSNDGTGSGRASEDGPSSDGPSSSRTGGDGPASDQPGGRTDGRYGEYGGGEYGGGNYGGGYYGAYGGGEYGGGYYGGYVGDFDQGGYVGYAAYKPARGRDIAPTSMKPKLLGR